MPENEKKPSSIKTPLIFIGFIAFSFIIYVIGIVIGFNYGQQIANSQNAQNIKETTPVSELCQSLLPPELDEIFSYTGKIIEKNEKNIVIETQTIENMALIKKNVTVYFNENTEFVKKDITSRVTPGEEELEQKISFEDLAIDNQISARSSDNIKGKSEFTANKIILYITNN